MRPRYGRIVAASTSLLITLVALLGAVGVVPLGSKDAGIAEVDQLVRATEQAGRTIDAAKAAATQGTTTGPDKGATEPATTPPAAQPAVPPTPAASRGRKSATDTPVGSGKRVVFDISDQRVWLVGRNNQVQTSYLVSGSLTDNLHPGTYSVYSRSRYAVGVEDSGTMQYFVRFTRGDNAAIGFHDIPVDNGRLVQTVQQLGTPRSHGCIRQKRSDAIELWDFAPVGTKVIVTS